jgi:hypothetical protein
MCFAFKNDAFLALPPANATRRHKRDSERPAVCLGTAKRLASGLPARPVTDPNLLFIFDTLFLSSSR